MVLKAELCPRAAIDLLSGLEWYHFTHLKISAFQIQIIIKGYSQVETEIIRNRFLTFIVIDYILE